MLTANKQVPLDLLKDYFALSEPEATVKSEKDNESTERIMTACVHFFENRKGYVFTGKSRTKVTNDYGEQEVGTYIVHHYSFEQTISDLLQRYFTFKEVREEPLETKEQFIRFFYNGLAHYKEVYYNNKHKKQFTHYKIAVVAAYLTHCFGFKLTTRQHCSPEELYQAGRHALKGI